MIILNRLKFCMCVFVCIYLIELFLGVQELCDSTDEFWIHEQRFTVTEQRWVKKTVSI